MWLASAVVSDTAKSFLICYDICDPKRLRRVHKAVRDVAMPVQFSVFLADLKKSELDALLEQLSQLIKVSEDKVNFYHLTAAKEKICLGLPPLSDDLLFF
jgi:CRISPR-associated protein Cas2